MLAAGLRTQEPKVYPSAYDKTDWQAKANEYKGYAEKAAALAARPDIAPGTRADAIADAKYWQDKCSAAKAGKTESYRSRWSEIKKEEDALKGSKGW
jgi:hypothetical protein